MHIATRIYEHMRDRRPDPWSQEELSRKTGIAQTMIGKILVTGDEFQKPEHVRAICDALEVDYEELIQPPDLVELVKAEVEALAGASGRRAARLLEEWPELETMLRNPDGAFRRRGLPHTPPLGRRRR